MSILSLSETKQIIEILFPFVESIPELPLKIALDVVKDEYPSLSFIAEGGGKKNFNVIGGHDGEFTFSIMYKIAGKDTKSRLEATKLLNYIGAFFDEKTKKGELPVLESSGDTSSKIEMVTLPTLIQTEENGNQVYSAGYVFTYRHKQKY